MPPTNSTGAVERSWKFRRDPAVVQAKDNLELEGAHSDRCAGIEIFLLGLAVDPALGIKPAMHLGPSATAGARENPQAEKDRGSAIPATQASPNSRQNDAKKTPMNLPHQLCDLLRDQANLGAQSQTVEDAVRRVFGAIPVPASTSRPRCGPGAGHGRGSRSAPCFPGLAAPHSGLQEGQ